MTQLQFTLNLDLLKDSVMNSNIDAVVKSTIVLVLNEYMEKERDEYLQTKAYEHTSERQDYRNGYYDRDFIVSIGKIKLRVPRTRNGTLHHLFLNAMRVWIKLLYYPCSRWL